MRWIVIILYVVCFGCYVLFTRQPDYFDSQLTTGVMVYRNDKLVGSFSDGKDTFVTEAPYQFMYTGGQHVKVIYEVADPSKAKVYSFWGYWIRFGELIASILIVVLLYYVAVSITSNPTPEALIEELEASKKKPPKPKYDL